MQLPPVGGGRKLLPLLFFCIPVIWLVALFAQAVQPGMSIAEAMASLTATLSNPFALAWTDRTAKCILLFLLSYGTAMGICVSDRRNYRRREEYGSAAWGSVSPIAKRYMAAKYEDNLLLTKRFYMGLDGHKHKRNLNVLVIGGSGAGEGVPLSAGAGGSGKRKLRCRDCPLHGTCGLCGQRRALPRKPL